MNMMASCIQYASTGCAMALGLPGNFINSSATAYVMTCRGLQTKYWWCWVAIAYDIGSIILNVCLFMCTTTYLGGKQRWRRC